MGEADHSRATTTTNVVFYAIAATVDCNFQSKFRTTLIIMITVAYWDIRGLGQPIRLLLNLVGEEFEDKFYSSGPAPDFNKDGWLKDKATLPLDFANLPYYMEGDVRISQTNAILRHIGRKHNLCGKTPAEQARVDMILDQTMDLRNGWVGLCYNPNYAQLKAGYEAGLPAKLKAFSKCLGDGNWFVGDEVTIADVHIYEILDQHLVWNPECLKDFCNLKNFHARFEALPNIKAYMSSPKFMRAPINNKAAAYGN